MYDNGLAYSITVPPHVDAFRLLSFKNHFLETGASVLHSDDWEELIVEDDLYALRSSVRFQHTSCDDCCCGKESEA